MSQLLHGEGAGAGGKGGRAPRRYHQESQAARLQRGGSRTSASRLRHRQQGNEFDTKWGYARFDEGAPRFGWLLDMSATTVPDEEGRERSGLDVYFLQQDGNTFKVTVFYPPYFYVGVTDDALIPEVSQLLLRKFDQVGLTVTPCDKEDLDMANHLSGKLHRFLRLSFLNVADLVEVKSALLPLIEDNCRRAKEGVIGAASSSRRLGVEDFFESLVDMREYDVPYVVRVAIDLDLRVGAWYDVRARGDDVELQWRKEMVEKAQPRVLAFDIECTKAPLKFPDANVDQIFMISYMIDGQGFLLINREVVSADIEDFEYTPKQQYQGPFQVSNLEDEAALLRHFIEHIQDLRPHVFVTYNGDFFDWPFVETRLRAHGIDMAQEIGVAEQQTGEYRARCAVHLDAFHWVKRDSYLPQGAQGLKAVTKYKLGYDPVEIDPEDMVRFASEQPAHMASYSVSDAVATYYLYMTYVHNFIFSLCTIIPMKAEDVLRKGSGTLCESLLMVEAFHGNIIAPNKQNESPLQFYKGHLLETETYVGGHVECLETGVYRCDLDYKFRLVPEALQRLIDSVDRDLRFAVETEGGAKVHDVVNFSAVKAEIVERLAELRDRPIRDEPPTIYHWDVGAMYPNIILTNRLQPCSIVDQADCAACDFNQEKNGCKRPMRWVWRGDHLPATRAEFDQAQTQLMYERAQGGQAFHELARDEQVKKVFTRLKAYCHKVYKKVRVTSQEERESTVCMRENPFYVNTVRAFRDRRNEYKALVKKWKGQRVKAEEVEDLVARKVAEDKEVVYDSLQLAHKCILNSFYGYVMRKGARWRSMEMAGIVTDTGARLIRQARELMEQIGRPLELDTDGIWCILPHSFPDTYTLITTTGSKIRVSYPCAMLNADVHERYTNHQYQTLADPATRKYATHSECSIFFEVDGPYRCMVLPSSTEEGKLLKKRYAVFKMDGSLAELKGFELKRRGELELIKAFQGQVFEYFLKGDTLAECYEAVAEIANYWLDVLDSRGHELDEEELMELISENKTISKTLEDYGDQKGTSLTTASRLADFLGPDMVKDRGLNCRLVIANRPHGAPVTDRAIPTAIFSTEPGVRKHFLRKWLKDPGMTDFGIRAIIDWDYYKERLGKTIQKIITIPAAMQRIANPVPRVTHPDWLDKKVRELTDGYRQLKIDSMFGARQPPQRVVDIEDTISARSPTTGSHTAVVRRVVKCRGDDGDLAAADEGSPQPETEGSVQTEETSTHAQQERKSANGEEAKSAALKRAKCPPLNVDFFGWLSFRKAQWREARLEKKMQERGLDRVGSRRGRPADANGAVVDAAGKPKRRMNVESFLKSAAMAVTHGVWQIIEIRETEIPGDFIVWAMTGQRALQRLSLSIDRTFYVTSNVDQESVFLKLGARKVNRLLPHGHRTPFMYEVVTAERRFLRNENGVGNLLCTPGVTGVYELQTPLWLRVVVQLGCVAQVNNRERQPGARGFRLVDLDSLSTTSHPYLHPSSALFRSIYIYHSQSGRQGIVSMFVILGDNRDMDPDRTADAPPPRPLSATCQVWLVNPYSNVEAKPPLKRILARYAPPGVTCTFTSSYLSSMSAAMGQLNSALASYQQERNGPTVVVAQSAMGITLLRRQAAVLNDMPVVNMPSNADDNRYPALGWQAYAARRMVQRFLLMQEWLQERLLIARYSHVPLGNIGLDAQRSMADVSFARLLLHNRHVLWASEGSKPDLGGAEGDENDAWADDAASPVIRVPGAYRKISIELEVVGLAVNSVRMSQEVDQVDGAQGFASRDVGKAGEGEAGMMGGDDRACSGTFRLLKTLVDNWLNDVHSSGNVLADGLLLNFWRWVCDPDSLLYDPAIRRLALMLMAKYFHRLVAELRRLGAKVIFANTHRITIATNKSDMASAQEYAEFVVNTVLSRPMFRGLHIAPVRFWWQLLFLDELNYGGLGFKEPVSPAQQLEEGDADMQVASSTVGQEDAGVSEAPRDVPADEAAAQEDPSMEDEETQGFAQETESPHGDESPEPFEGQKRRRRIVQDDDDESDVDGKEGLGDYDDDDEEEGVGGGGQPKRRSAKGRLEELDDEDAGGEAGQELSAEGAYEDADHEYSHHWDMLNYLPSAVRPCFDFIVAMFLAAPMKEENDQRLVRQGRAEALANELLTASGGLQLSQEQTLRVLHQDDEAQEAELTRFVQKLVSGRITRQLLDWVQGIDDTLRGPEAFPVMVGSHKQLSKPALDFVKVISNVLALDSAVEAEIMLMRRQLLAKLRVREFADEGLSTDYCRSFTLPDVTCNFCNLCRDLDLCRDTALLSEDEDDWWRCPECRHRYDVTLIEQLLMEAVERLITRSCLQDVRCAKCRRVGTLLMADTCKCSGRLAGDETPERFDQTLETLRRVAAHYKLPRLKETVHRALRKDVDEETQ